MSNFHLDRNVALHADPELKDRTGREAVREFFLKAIEEGTYGDTYCAYGYPIEEELMGRFLAFCHPEDKGTELAVHNLKLVRRFLLQRYSFLSSRRVDKELRGSVSPVWLWKDYAIPRIGLSLVIGFGAVLGSSATFEFLAGLRGTAAILFAQACLLVVLVLIYLNVRDVVTGAHPNVWGRTLWVFAVALAWVGIELSLAAWLNSLMHWHFDWRHGALAGSSALVLAVLTQFFFTKAGSMAKPL